MAKEEGLTACGEAVGSEEENRSILIPPLAVSKVDLNSQMIGELAVQLV